METVFSNQAPAAVGPYSQAVRVGNLLFCSGQVGIDPLTKELGGKSIEAQTAQVLKNMGAVLEAAGLGLQDVIKTTVFLASMEDFPTVNVIYEKVFAPHKPARSTIEVARLPLDALIEIECIATY